MNAKEEREISLGFPWAFDNEIAQTRYYATDGSGWKTEPLASSPIHDGAAVEVYAKGGAFLGTGIINKKSKITVRLISEEHADKVFESPREFWAAKVRAAANIRRLHFKDSESYRLIFGEADFMPGLIVERFCDTRGDVFLVAQFLALATEVFREEILDALEKVCKPKGIYERSDADIREKEGLEERTGFARGGGKTAIQIEENGVLFEVDIARGQKTGHFLDQRENRVAAAAFCKGKRVLDAFAYNGAFGLNAARAGASEVVAIDISSDAVDLINKNIALNGAQKVMRAECADVFDVLKKYEEAGEKFDVIILDPPAFTKSAKMIQKAYGGYKEINLRAMRLLRDSGILVTCSCSYFFDSRVFYEMLARAAADSHRRVQILEKRGAAPDHPILLGYSRSEYLKCAIARVI